MYLKVYRGRNRDSEEIAKLENEPMSFLPNHPISWSTWGLMIVIIGDLDRHLIPFKSGGVSNLRKTRGGHVLVNV